MCTVHRDAKREGETMTPDDIEASLVAPPEMAQAIRRYTVQQDLGRGDWPSPRRTPQGTPPWPTSQNPMLRYLLWKARASIDAGMDVELALLQLAVHAWFEGGVENYDRGRVDASHEP